MIAALDRFELKLLLGASQRATIETNLAEELCADPHAAADAGYPVVSLYYDTPDRRCYWERESGLPSRRKLRIRIYGRADGTVPAASFIEIKQKCGGRSGKRRVRISIPEALAICAGESPRSITDPADLRTIAEVHHLVRRDGFAPCAVVRYERRAFAGTGENADVRVTFDTRIGYRFHDLEPEMDDRRFDRHLLDDGSAVMELKVTGAVPYRIARMLASHRCPMRGHSKYCEVLKHGDPVIHHMTGRGQR